MNVPKGPYCYSGHLGKNRCPFYTYKELNKVKIPFCSYLGDGDITNLSPHDIMLLCEYFSCAVEDLDRIFPLDFLWDQVKECGLELDDDQR